MKTKVLHLNTLNMMMTGPITRLMYSLADYQSII